MQPFVVGRTEPKETSRSQVGKERLASPHEAKRMVPSGIEPLILALLAPRLNQLGQGTLLKPTECISILQEPSIASSQVAALSTLSQPTSTPVPLAWLHLSARVGPNSVNISNIRIHNKENYTNSNAAPFTYTSTTTKSVLSSPPLLTKQDSPDTHQTLLSLTTSQHPLSHYSDITDYYH